MDKKHLLKEYIYNHEKLLDYGFKTDNTTFILKKSIENTDCYFKIQIAEDRFDIDIYDNSTNEQYILFNIKNSNGNFIGEMKRKANELIIDILKNCFENINHKREIVEFITKTFAVKENFPWAKHPNYCTFKTKIGKWFVLILDIPAKKLNIGDEEMISIINLKGVPEKIQLLIDYKRFFPTYHMNKINWLTIILNKDTSLEQLKELIVESYHLVDSTK